MADRLPRGILNRNPGNIRKSKDRWQGLADEQTDESFWQFKDAAWGIRALAIVLRNYGTVHHLRTVREIIARWAPSTENDTEAYIQAVADHVGMPGDALIDIGKRPVMKRLVQAIIQHENGVQPYNDATIDEALTKAGIV